MQKKEQSRKNLSNSSIIGEPFPNPLLFNSTSNENVSTPIKNSQNSTFKTISDSTACFLPLKIENIENVSTEQSSIPYSSFDPDEEEISFRSEESERSKSENSFQTPSSSLQNLLGNEDDEEFSKIDEEIGINLEDNNSRMVSSNSSLIRSTSLPEVEVLQKPFKSEYIPIKSSDISSSEISSNPIVSTSLIDKDEILKGAEDSSQHDTIGILASQIPLSTESSCCGNEVFTGFPSHISGALVDNITATTLSQQATKIVSTSVTPVKQLATISSVPSGNKKKMWYHVFTSSYKTRSHEFRKYFKELPSEEKLLGDYSCALQKEILVQGRMYLSQNFLSFYANIFGWQTLMSIKFKEITSITKENTALVIPNAIQISLTPSDKYFFTSFVSRDVTYLMLFKLWQKSLLDQIMTGKELWNLVRDCYGEIEVGSEEDGSTVDGDYLSLSGSSTTGSISGINVPVTCPLRLEQVPSGSTLSAMENDPLSLLLINNSQSNDERTLNQVCLKDLELSTGSFCGPSNEAKLIDSTLVLEPPGKEITGTIPNLEVTDLSDSTESDDEDGTLRAKRRPDKAENIPTCPSDHQDGRIVLNTIIPCSVDTLFTMLFTNSKFYLEFHTLRKTFDIIQEDWQEKDGKTLRQVSFTVTLNQRMGPKHSQITETQVLLSESKPGVFYAVDIESNNAGIPYADSFYVTCHFCLSRVSATESRLLVVAQLRYRKSIWGLTKTFIEKNSWAGIEEFYASLEKGLKAEVATTIPGIVESFTQSPRISKTGLVRRRPLRKKGPAPGIPSQNLPLTTVTQNISDVGVAGHISKDSYSRNGIFELSFAFKVVLLILVKLSLLNGFLYWKLNKLESSSVFGGPSHSSLFSSHPPITFSKETPPQSHDEWLNLLQRQEALHRMELQKWHGLLLSALQILKVVRHLKAEGDLETLKVHVDQYSHNRLLVEPTISSTTSFPTSSQSLSNYNNQESQSTKPEDEIERGKVTLTSEL